MFRGKTYAFNRSPFGVKIEILGAYYKRAPDHYRVRNKTDEILASGPRIVQLGKKIYCKFGGADEGARIAVETGSAVQVDRKTG